MSASARQQPKHHMEISLNRPFYFVDLGQSFHYTSLRSCMRIKLSGSNWRSANVVIYSISVCHLRPSLQYILVVREESQIQNEFGPYLKTAATLAQILMRNTARVDIGAQA